MKLARVFRVALVALLVDRQAVLSQSAVPSGAVQPVEVAPGVFVFPSYNTMDISVDGNSTFIIGSTAVLVVDAPSTKLTAAHLAWLRQHTKVPIRYLVNTHWHADHIRGNQVLADSCPGLSILASEFTKRVGDRRGPVVMARMKRGYADSTLAAMRAQVASGRDENGKQMTPVDVGRLRRFLDYLAQDLPTRKDLRYVGPTEIVESERRIDLGGKAVVVRRYPGHTLGDLVAIVEGDGVVITGDLVVAPVPYGTAQTVFRQWSASLSSLEKLPGIKTIVPGHGAVLHSWDYVRLEREAIDSLMAQVTAGVREGLTFEQTSARVNMARFKELFAGADADRQWAFDNYFLGIRRAFDEAMGLVN